MSGHCLGPGARGTTFPRERGGGGNAVHYILEGATTLGTVTLNSAGSLVTWDFNLVAAGQVVGRHTNTGARFYYHTDALGSTRAVVNASGTVIEAYTYYPFGLLNEGLSVAPGATREQFTGKELDAETSMSYFGARYYMAALGRWGAVDPLADQFPGWSPYNYVLGNPTGLVDPDGLSPCAEGETTSECAGRAFEQAGIGRTSFTDPTEVPLSQCCLRLVAVGIRGGAILGVKSAPSSRWLGHSSGVLSEAS